MTNEKKIIDEIQTLKHEIIERIERLETGTDSRMEKNDKDYYQVLKKLSREERKTIYLNNDIEYMNGIQAALSTVDTAIYNILAENGIKPEED